MRDALKAILSPPARGTHPGYTKRFEEFLDSVRKPPQKRIILMVENPHTGERRFVDGTVYERFTNEAVVCISMPSGGATIVRRDIAGWFTGRDADIHAFALELLQEGWLAPRRYI